MAVPVALSIALCLTHYAPRRVATVLGFAIDLLAAVPSIVFGLWGRDYLVKPVSGLSAWLHTYFGWIPLFGSDGPYGKSILLGSMVLAIMVLPIVTALVARGVRADADDERGGRAGPGRDEVGDDPHRGPARTAGPASSPRSCSASAARSARRSPWR